MQYTTLLDSLTEHSGCYDWMTRAKQLIKKKKKKKKKVLLIAHALMSGQKENIFRETNKQTPSVISKNVINYELMHSRTLIYGCDAVIR